MPPSPLYQRTPIDPSRVVCLGPLPENVQIPQLQQPPMPPPRRAVTGTDGAGSGFVARTVPPLSPVGSVPTLHRAANRSTSTLGSHYTDEEEQIVEELTRQASLSQGSPVASLAGAATLQQPHQRRQHHHREPASPRSQERIDAGSELIHVPQLAERRYSWEEPDNREERR